MLFLFGGYNLEPARRELRRGDALITLTSHQLDLLVYFVTSRGRLLSKQDLLDHVWHRATVADNVISVAVAKLRKALGRQPSGSEYIVNHYARGYRFLAEVTLVASAPAQRVSAATPVVQPERPKGPMLVGRCDITQRLEDALVQAVSGRGKLCVLNGEAGIGKTRLAESLEPSARTLGAICVWGRCQPVGNAPQLWPFVQVMRELSKQGPPVDILNADWEPAVAQAAKYERPYEFTWEAISSSHRTIDQMAETLYRVAAARPLVILLDDLQWADAVSLRLLRYLSEDLSRHPLLVVATLRTSNSADELREHNLSRVLRHGNCERIEVRRLSAIDVDEYVTASIGRQEPELSQGVFTRSEGNPFFMIELLRPWEGRTSQVDPTQLQLSGVASGLLRRRIEKLPLDVRNVLSAAAVIGHNFDLGLLSHVAERSHEAVLECLDESLANDTVVPSSESAGAYAFDHELVREVLYGELSANERCRLHLRVAEALSKRHAAGAEVPHSELAHHHLSALPHGDAETAIAFARKAAIEAHRLSGTVQARVLLRRAIASLSLSLDAKADVRAALRIELAMVERALGNVEYVEHLAQGVALAREHRFGALLTFAGQLLSPGPGLIVSSDATHVLEAALEVLPEDDDKHRALALVHLAWTPPHCGSTRRVAALLGEAEERAQRSRASDAVGAVRRARMYFLAGPDTVHLAEQIATEIEHEARTSDRVATRLASVVSSLRLIVAVQRGDQPGIQHALNGRKAILERRGDIELQWHYERWLVALRMNRGEFTHIARDLAHLRERAKRFRFQYGREVLAQDYAIFLQWTGDLAPLLPRLRTGLVPRDSEAPLLRSRKLRNMAEFGFHDDLKSSMSLVTVAGLEDLPRSRDYLCTLCNFATACVVAGKVEHCELLYDLLAPHAMYYAVDTSMHVDGSVSYFLARLARALGRMDAALTHYEEALERHRADGLFPRAVQSGIELAQLLYESRPAASRQARALLRGALNRARDMGLKPLASIATQELQRR